MVETLLEGLKTAATTFATFKPANSSRFTNYVPDDYGTPEDAFQVSKELGLTGVTTLKIVFDALPDNLKQFIGFNPETLNRVEDMFRLA
jgi:hypothetical protein